MLFADLKTQIVFEIKLVEVGDYNGTNQDPPVPKMTSKWDFPYFEKCQAKRKKIAHELWYSQWCYKTMC